MLEGSHVIWAYILWGAAILAALGAAGVIIGKIRRKQGEAHVAMKQDFSKKGGGRRAVRPKSLNPSPNAAPMQAQRPSPMPVKPGVPFVRPDPKRLMEQQQQRQKMEALALMKHQQKCKAAYHHAAAADEMVHHEYWKQGGIRFYAEQLLQRLKELDQDATPQSMGVDLYNSAILPVRNRLCRIREKQNEPIKIDGDADAELLSRLEQMDLNQFLRTAVVDETTYVPRYDRLFQRLEQVFEGEDATALCPDKGSTQELCHACAAHLLKMTEALLEDFSLPM